MRAIEIDRFEAPSTLACGLFAIYVLWPTRPAEDRSCGASLPSSRAFFTRASAELESAAGTVGRRRLPIGTATLVLLLGLAGILFGGTLGHFWRSSDTSVRQGYEVVDGSIGFSDRYVYDRPEYRHLNAAIPRGAHVLAAVDYPALMDFSRYQFATLDLAGAASPAPHMPYFKGAAAKVTYLRHLGYQFIVADSPTEPGLYQLGPWKKNLRSSAYNYRAWAPYFIDWANSVASLERGDSYRVRHFGTLVLIQIEPRNVHLG